MALIRGRRESLVCGSMAATTAISRKYYAELALKPNGQGIDGLVDLGFTPDHIMRVF